MSEPTKEELMARIAELEKQTGSRPKGTLEFRVGEKGGVSVYGLGRFPVTLYYEQWNRLLGAADDIKKFMEENKPRLKLTVAHTVSKASVCSSCGTSPIMDRAAR